MSRTSLPPGATVGQLKAQLAKELGLDTAYVAISTRPTPGNPAQKLDEDRKTLTQYNLKNGDGLVVMTPQKEDNSKEADSSAKDGNGKEVNVVTTIGSKGEIVKSEEAVVEEVVEDEVDQLLHKQDGWINKRDPKSKTATPDDYIAPWCIQQHSPWKEQKIKHLPFHSWIKEQTYRSGSNTQPSLVEDTYRQEKTERLTSKQISASTATVNRQTYRHVDHVLFQHQSIVENFIGGWRQGGMQRCGFLIGKYVPDETIPLGIAAEVVAIYEPPQQSTRESALLLKDPHSDEVDALLAKMKLRRVGFIWTNLIVNEKREIINDRDPETPLLPTELIRMAHLQARYPSPWAKSRSRKFGSKFVSVIVRGTSDNNVELDAYMLSNQGVALITEGVIKSSKKDSKNFRVVRTTPESKFIFPDLLFSDRDDYNNVTTKKADPWFPSAFFIIGLRHGFPKDPDPLFRSFTFPTENREKPPSYSDVNTYLSESKQYLSKQLLDFHLLHFVGVENPLPVLADLIVALVKGEPIKEDRLKQIVGHELDKKIPKAAPVSSTLSKPAGKITPASSGASKGAPDQYAKVRSELQAMGFQDQQINEALFACPSKNVDALVNFMISS